VIAPFDVNNPQLRKEFLASSVAGALSGLSPDHAPAWGHMSPQQMVEHLLWAMELSTGVVKVECRLPARLVERFKTFLYTNDPTSHDFMNPLLKTGLPSPRFSSIEQAAAALGDQTQVFLSGDGIAAGERRVHPVFGPLDHDEWSRAHFKHFYHHLLQFGRLEEARG